MNSFRPIIVFLVILCPCTLGYVFYPLASNALYQEGIPVNVSFVYGRLGIYAESAGYGSSLSYNGLLAGITVDRTETYAFFASSECGEKA